MANARQVKLISASSRKDDQTGRAAAGSSGPGGPAVAAPDPAPKRGSAGGSDAGPGAGSAGGRAHQLGEQRRAAYARRRASDCPAAIPIRWTWNGRRRCRLSWWRPLRPLFEAVESLTETDPRVRPANWSRSPGTRYPETKLLRQVKGVGTLIALTFVLTLEDKDRFARSRDVGCYVGLRPQAQRNGRKPATAAHYQRRGRLPAEDAGAGSALHSGASGTGYGSEAVGTEAGRRRRKEREEAGASWQWRESSRCCCTVCGSRAKCTNRCGTRGRWTQKKQRLKESVALGEPIAEFG